MPLDIQSPFFMNFPQPRVRTTRLALDVCMKAGSPPRGRGRNDPNRQEDRTMRTPWIKTGLAMLAVGLLATGCSTTGQEKTCGFPDENRAGPGSIALTDCTGCELRVPDRRDPKAVVAFARTLSANGRFDEAAGVYLDAAKRFRSADERFEADCRKAAVREYWLGGHPDKARELLDDIEANQDLYSRAAEQDSLRKLRELLTVGDAQEEL